jgi:hypothetical protein
MSTIDEMQALIDDLRELLQSFDLTEHNDEANEDHITTAIAGLDQLEGAVGDLVP